MSEDAFQGFINSLMSQWMQTENDRKRSHGRFWDETVSKQYNFDRGLAEVQYFRTLTKDDITNFCNTHIVAEAPERRKLAVYIIGKGLPSADVKRNSLHEISDLDELKQSLEFYPLPEPNMSLLRAAQAVKHTCSEQEMSVIKKTKETTGSQQSYFSYFLEHFPNFPTFLEKFLGKLVFMNNEVLLQSHRSYTTLTPKQCTCHLVCHKRSPRTALHIR